jgi:hypothetical protein
MWTSAKITSCGILTTVLLSISLGHVAAHPGGLDASGCHTKRSTGEYHCHRKGTALPLVGKSKTLKKTPCEDFPPCRGCGCKGGPGYRSNQTGKCVGYKQLNAECGSPPTTGCRFENEPGSGVNRSCVLGQ